VAFYVIGFNSDTWDSITATIEHSISLGTSLAQFKMLTPYPGTPLWKHMAGQVVERDWERFDGFSVTFRHPNLSADELRFLLAMAYARFYLRLRSSPDCGVSTAAGESRRAPGRNGSQLHSRQERAACQEAAC
jgi:hypothetical protein